MSRKRWFLPLLTAVMLVLLYLPEHSEPLRAAALPPAERAAEQPRININTAPIDLLMELPGIGETLAQRIVDYRSEHGPFSAPEDITGVYGIGAGKLSQIIDYITTEDTP